MILSFLIGFSSWKQWSCERDCGFHERGPFSTGQCCGQLHTSAQKRQAKVSTRLAGERGDTGARARNVSGVGGGGWGVQIERQML